MVVIRAENFVLVTNNGRDFRRLYRQEAIHTGLIIILPGDVGAGTQVRLFGLALDAVESLPDLIDKVVEIDASGTVRMMDLPEP